MKTRRETHREYRDEVVTHHKIAAELLEAEQAVAKRIANFVMKDAMQDVNIVKKQIVASIAVIMRAETVVFIRSLAFTRKEHELFTVTVAVT